MLRKTLTILSLIGLLLSVGAWGVSYQWVIFTPSHPERPVVTLRAGCLVLAEYRLPVGLVPLGFSWYGYNGEGTWWIRSPGANFLYTTNRAGWYFVLPLWIPTLAFGSVLYFYHPMHRRRKRKKLGLCLNCGYDLRASKDRCPECGTGY